MKAKLIQFRTAMALTKEDAVQLGLDMLSKRSNVKFFELKVSDPEAMEYVAKILRNKGCTVESDPPSLTLRVFCLKPFIGG